MHSTAHGCRIIVAPKEEGQKALDKVLKQFVAPFLKPKCYIVAVDLSTLQLLHAATLDVALTVFGNRVLRAIEDPCLAESLFLLAFR